MRSLVSLYLRIRSAEGRWVYARAVVGSNKRIKPLHAMVDGKPEHRPEGVYHLRYAFNGKRIWQAVGTDASLAQVALERKSIELQAVEYGIVKAAAPTVPTTVLASPQLATSSDEDSPAPLTKSSKRGQVKSLTTLICEYLAETKEHKSDKTWLAYRATLISFAEFRSGKTLSRTERSDEESVQSLFARLWNDSASDITREDVLAYIAFLRKRGMGLVL